MIQDVIDFGKWLYTHDLEVFGKETYDDDYILPIYYENNNFKINEFILKNDFNFNNYYDKSVFNKDFYISTNQMFMIPSTEHLMGFSPFFLKLNHSFYENTKIKKDELNKFNRLFDKSYDVIKNNKSFIDVLDNEIFNDFESYLTRCHIKSDDKLKYFRLFNKKFNLDFLNSTIVNYYKFLSENKEVIIDKIIKLKNDSEKYDSDKYSNFYITCYFGNELDLLNDLFLNYSKFIQRRKKTVKNYGKGYCSFCKSKGITYSSVGSYTLDSMYSFNYKDKVENSRLRVCNECNAYIKFAEDKLKKILNVPNMMILPKNKNDADYSKFLKIANSDINSFSKINSILDSNSIDFNYDLILYEIEKSKTYSIKKYVENYQSFLIRFENINSFDNNKLNYLFNEEIKVIDNYKREINNLFDLEDIFKLLFFYYDDYGIHYFNHHFYEIYTKDINNLLKKFDSKTSSIFIMYMHSIFNIIYELNIDSLNKNMMNNIFINALFKLQKHITNLDYDSILIYLNYYFMFKKEFMEDNMLNNENVKNLKNIFGKYYNSNIEKNKENAGSSDGIIDDEKDKYAVISKDDIISINEIMENDPAIKYYLLGQFIRLIDNFKGQSNKNSTTFSDYILNVNRNNIKKLFVTEILQKNNFYIAGLNVKGKFIFNILENNFDSMFNEGDNFSFEDYLLLMFTGYYTTNILSSSYKKEDY